MRRLSRRSLAFGLTAAALVLGAALPGAALAQSDAKTPLDANGDPLPPTGGRRPSRTFALFGNADIAYAYIKNPGPFVWCATSSGDMDRFICGEGATFAPKAAAVGGLGTNGTWFRETRFVWGVPPSQRTKIQNLANGKGAGLQFATGGGFNVRTPEMTGGADALLPVDNQLGTYWSGAQVRADGSCLDHTYALTAGLPLMPTSDCPATWGSLGWQGRRSVPGEQYLAFLNTRGFDFWKYPSGEPDPAGRLEEPMGSFQTFAEFSDFSTDELCGTPQTRTYGRVINPARPDCPNIATQKQGYPLGLTARLDAFNFGIPALQDIVFYQMTIRNDSRVLYGEGVNYDSLYLGIITGVFGPNQEAVVHIRPDINGFVATQQCKVRAPMCNGALGRGGDLLPTDADMSNQPAFARGSIGLTVLASPIGDVRNKLFTRAGSPFQGLGDPTKWDDTITVNHAHLCGFRACNNLTYATDPSTVPDHSQRAFGMISSTERNVLGTRVPTALTDQHAWHTFRSADYPAKPPLGTGPGDFPQTGGFNRWVPGATASTGQWDYNNDGVQDTLFLDACSGKTGQVIPGRLTTDTYCAAAFSDTTPGRGLSSYANTGFTITAGPVSLMADSVTKFVFAKTSACCGVGRSDSLALYTKLNAAISLYQNFYLGPNPRPRDTIVSVEVVGGPPVVNQVRLTFTETAERANDPYTLSLAQAKAVEVSRQTRLNPWLADSLTAYALPFGTRFLRVGGTPGVSADSLTAVGNLDRIFIFRSCDRGVSFSNNAGCTPSPATGAPFDAVGWLPYATLVPTAGSVVNQFVDPNVNAGTTYTYAVVSATRGVRFPIIIGQAYDSVPRPGGGYTYFCTVACRTEVTEFTPTLFNPVTTSGPNVATVYVPISEQAGSAAPPIVVQTVAGSAAPNRITIRPAATQPVPGTYTVAFYDSVTVVRRTITVQGQQTYDSTFVQPYAGGVAATPLTTRGRGGIGINGTTGVSSSETRNVTGGGDSVTVVRTTRVLGVSGGRVAVLSRGTEPILVTNVTSGNVVPETFFSSTLYPGFDLLFSTLADRALITVRGPLGTGEQFTTSAGDTLVALSSPFVRTQSTVLATAFQGGLLNFEWEGNVFGPGSPFTLDFSNRAGVEAAVQASLNARPVAQTGLTTEEAATASGIPLADLVAVRLPFEITNVSFGRPVEVVMRRRGTRTIATGDVIPANTFRLGVGTDTMTVPIPADAWVPGDTLILLERIDGTLRTTFSRYVLGCGAALNLGQRLGCNPVALSSAGSTGFIDTPIGTIQSMEWVVALTNAQRYSFTIAPTPRGTSLADACTDAGDAVVCAAQRSDIKRVKVVPNPYIGTSNYIDPTSPANVVKPIIFTHVPPRGVLKIWTVSGQLVQQITWDETQLNGTGDLLWDLRTREGNLIAGGLYLFTISGRDSDGRGVGSKMGKFVVVR